MNFNLFLSRHIFLVDFGTISHIIVNIDRIPGFFFKQDTGLGKYFIPRVKFRQPTDRTIKIKCMRMKKMMELTFRKKLSPMLIYVRKSFRVRDSTLIDYLNNTYRCIMQGGIECHYLSFTIHSLARNIRRSANARVNLIKVIICFTDNKTGRFYQIFKLYIMWKQSKVIYSSDR